jgi:hypothetical protein
MGMVPGTSSPQSLVPRILRRLEWRQVTDMAFADQEISLSSFRVGDAYSRADIARVGNVRPPKSSRDPNWAQGPVAFANAVLLFVTLDKSNRKEYEYEDRYEDQMFWWQSQNQQTQRSPVIQAILSRRKSVCLFVRTTEKRKSKTCPFVYCGQLTEPIPEGERPVTVLFENPDFAIGATGALREVYEWRPTKTPNEQETVREKRILERAPRASGQGRVQDVRVRLAIERRAMVMAREHYEQLGYTVSDTSRARPYDYVVARGGEKRRVEVKGTVSDGSSVTLTGGEVEAVRAGPEATDLFVLSRIDINMLNGTPVAAGGSLRLITNWRPQTTDLTPTEYRYALPVPRTEP